MIALETFMSLKSHYMLKAAAALFVLTAGITAGLGTAHVNATSQPNPEENAMQTGHFSVSLAVKDLAASRDFYAKLGFTPVGGEPDDGWQILRNGHVVIGLFQGMFNDNILTFNPGWDQDQNALDEFQDVREIQSHLKESGLELELETDPEGEGIGHIVLKDPDGNMIMFDQHVPKPGD